VKRLALKVMAVVHCPWISAKVLRSLLAVTCGSGALLLAAGCHHTRPVVVPQACPSCGANGGPLARCQAAGTTCAAGYAPVPSGDQGICCAPISTPSPTPVPAPAMPSRVLAWFREGGGADEGNCAGNPGDDGYHVGTSADCHNGYRYIAPWLNAHTTPDCMVQGTDTTLDDEMACWQLYIPTIERDYPGLPWIITIDERGRQTDQYALYPWCKTRWCAVTGSDEWCDASATKANVRAQVDAYHAETTAAYGHPLPVIGVLGPEAMTDQWCDGWDQWDIVAPELYALPPTTPDQMASEWNLAATMVATDKVLGACLQHYSRNGSITDPRQMASYPIRGWQTVAGNPRVRFVIPFSGYRQYGTMWHRPILGPVASWGRAAYLEGGDTANPPWPAAAATPTPAPTPKPADPGVLNPGPNTSTWEPGTTDVYFWLEHKDYGSAAPAWDLPWHATCLTSGADCPNLDGVAHVPAVGAGDATVAWVRFSVPPQTLVGSRYWRIDYGAPTNGGRFAGGVNNVSVRSAQADVSFLVPSFGASPGNPIGAWLIRGGDCSGALQVSLRLHLGTLTDAGYGGVDVGGSAAPIMGGVYTFSPGSCSLSVQQPTLSTAVSGHAGTLEIVGTQPSVPLGRLTTATMGVR